MSQCWARYAASRLAHLHAHVIHRFNVSLASLAHRWDEKHEYRTSYECDTGLHVSLIASRKFWGRDGEQSDPPVSALAHCEHPHSM